jgi:hypothetical protein
MSIPIQSIVLQANGAWSFAWANTGQTFSRVVLWGSQVANTGSSNTYIWAGQGYGNYPPPLEIAYENQQVLTEIYNPVLALQWYGLPTVNYYLVQYLNGSVWTQFAQVLETGQWIYTINTPALPDESTYQFRVIAVDSVGNQSAPLGYEVYTVTCPTPVDSSINIVYGPPNTVIVSSK